jgi:hypothetical protein
MIHQISAGYQRRKKKRNLLTLSDIALVSGIGLSGTPGSQKGVLGSNPVVCR